MNTQRQTDLTPITRISNFPDISNPYTNGVIHANQVSGNLSFLCKSDGNSLQTHSIVIVDLVYTGADAEQSELK